MLRILHHLARIYQASAAGRSGSNRDFTIDYEKFLRLAHATDGDEREIAEQELDRAESQSGGLLHIDRHPRSAAPVRLRLAKDGGESWLFTETGADSPESRRSALADSFTGFARREVPEPWQEAWTTWFTHLATLALQGGSVQPFRRDDPDGNRELTDALLGILRWQGPSLVRYASVAICGDSKRIQALEPRLRAALAAITGNSSLDDFGILRKPRSITFHGPLTITLGSRSTDFSMFPAAVTLAETNLPATATLATVAPLCLTVENEDTFHELAATNPGVLLVLTSYPGSAVRRMIELLPAGLRFLHFGDSDPTGSDLLRDLREKTGRDIQPLLIPAATASPTAKSRPLREHDLRVIRRLLDSILPTALRPHLEQLLASGEQHAFEQEAFPVALVWHTLKLGPATTCPSGP